jgi:hypothetical protein
MFIVDVSYIFVSTNQLYFNQIDNLYKYGETVIVGRKVFKKHYGLGETSLRLGRNVLGRNVFGVKRHTAIESLHVIDSNSSPVHARCRPVNSPGSYIHFNRLYTSQ